MQQFYEILSSKARTKLRSLTWSSSLQDEELGQRLEAKLSAAEQKRWDFSYHYFSCWFVFFGTSTMLASSVSLNTVFDRGLYRICPSQGIAENLPLLSVKLLAELEPLPTTFRYFLISLMLATIRHHGLVESGDSINKLRCCKKSLVLLCWWCKLLNGHLLGNIVWQWNINCDLCC